MCWLVGRHVTLTMCQSSFWSKNQFVVPIYVFWIVWGWFGYVCSLAVLVHGFDVGRFWVATAEIGQNRGQEKNWVLVVMDSPRKILIFFSSWYQCWLNCQKIFSAGNPQSVNNVRHFALCLKFRPQLREFACHVLQERGTPIFFCFLLLILCTGQLVMTI